MDTLHPELIKIGACQCHNESVKIVCTISKENYQKQKGWSKIAAMLITASNTVYDLWKCKDLSVEVSPVLTTSMLMILDLVEVQKK